MTLLRPVLGRSPSVDAPCVLPLSASRVTLVRGGRTVLDAVDMTLDRARRITVVLGPNGAGKSLLTRCLAGLVAPDSGTVQWAGSAPDRWRITRIGFVFQKPVLLARTAEANITYALGVARPDITDPRERARAALAAARLGHLADQPAGVLSGGEQQRLALARAVACEPDVFILDEATANLDPASTAEIEALLRDIRARGTPVLLITHDLAQARRLADTVIFMARGKIVETAEAARFFTAPTSPEGQAFVRGEIVL